MMVFIVVGIGYYQFSFIYYRHLLFYSFFFHHRFTFFVGISLASPVSESISQSGTFIPIISFINLLIVPKLLEIAQLMSLVFFRCNKNAFISQKKKIALITLNSLNS